jgi:hypothetical protein
MKNPAFSFGTGHKDALKSGVDDHQLIRLDHNILEKRGQFVPERVPRPPCAIRPACSDNQRLAAIAGCHRISVAPEAIVRRVANDFLNSAMTVANSARDPIAAGLASCLSGLASRLAAVSCVGLPTTSSRRRPRGFVLYPAVDLDEYNRRPAPQHERTYGPPRLQVGFYGVLISLRQRIRSRGRAHGQDGHPRV